MLTNKIQYPYIVADIGGTNARFAIIAGKNAVDGQFILKHQKTYPSIEFDDIESVTRFYMNSFKNITFSGACLAVAGPVISKNIQLTNLNWHFNIDEVARSLKCKNLKVLNDFAASAIATSHVAQSHLFSLNDGQGVTSAPIAVVGPGTGFGVAALAPQNGYYNILPTEGGHMTIAANNQLQTSILQRLSKQYDHISIEKVLSGPGLSNLYHCLAEVEGIPAESLSTAEITQQALSELDGLSYRTLMLFTSWLGSVTGDLALSLGARGGVFLAGGILPRIKQFLQKSQFMQHFVEKGPMTSYLSQIPVKLVTEGNSALLGAASWYENKE